MMKNRHKLFLFLVSFLWTSTALSQPLISFNSGELSPLLKYRLDYEGRYLGCATVEHLIVKPQGAAVRRPGTYYIAQTKDNGAVILVSFIYAATDAYVLEFGNLYIRFYRNGGQVLDANGHPYEVETIYIGSQLRDLHFVQSNDVIYIFHPDVPTYKLSRYAHTNWTIAEVDWQKGPFRDENTTETSTITASATTGDITLTASVESLWDAEHVGALWQLTHPVDANAVTGSFVATGSKNPEGNVTNGTATALQTSANLGVSRNQDFTVVTNQYFWGTLTVERSYDDGATWGTVYSFEGTGDNRVIYSGTETIADAYYRLKLVDHWGLFVSRHLNYWQFSYTLASVAYERQGIVEITAVTDANHANATVIYDLGGTSATFKWAEGAWSDYRGYARTGCFYQSRLACAGSESLPRTIWLSRSFEFENMGGGGTDDGAIVYEMAGVQQNKILWLAAKNGILAGTSGSVMRVVSADGDNTALTYANITAEQISTSSSMNLQPATFADTLMFLDRDKRKIRRLVYDLQSNETVAADMTMVAEHITESGIVDMDHQAAPDPILWAVRADGVLLSMTYDAQQRINGWARHPFETAPGLGGELTGGQGEYPTLQELTAAEIPDTPAEPADGTLVAPTSVTTAIGLQAIAGAGHYTIDADIDLTGVTWTPIVGFSGKIEGNDYTISNLSIVSALGAHEQGLFGSLQTNAEIRNLNFSNCTVTGSATSTSVGILAGNSDYRQSNIILKHITLTNCSVTGYDFTGCLIGYLEQCDTSFVYDCHTVNCTVQGIVDGDYNGSLIGFFRPRATAADKRSYIINCSADGGQVLVSRSGAGFGGLIGYAQGTFFSTGLPGASFYSAAGIYDCYSSASLNGSDSYDSARWGGLVGQSEYVDFVSCYATGNLSISWTNSEDAGTSTVNYIGGFIGNIRNGLTLTNCYATGNITVTAIDENCGLSRVGGFAGEMWSKWTNLTRCYATGSITMTGKILSWYGVGGFLGILQTPNTSTVIEVSTIERCWSTGDITIAQGAQRSTVYYGGAGGFLGLLFSYDNPFEIAQIIQNCYAWGSIEYTDNASDIVTGGFLGGHGYGTGVTDPYIDISFINCYAAQTNTAAGSGYTNQLPPGSFTNGFYGYDINEPNTVSVTAIFWDTDTSGIATDDYAVGHITDWMQTQTNYEAAGWDFDTLWQLTTTVYDYTVSGLGINSVAVIPADDAEDEVWLAVTRVINSVVTHTIEQMQPQNWGTDANDIFFVDCGLTYDGDATTILTGLTHLAGETVTICGNGGYYQTATVTEAGKVTLNEAMSVAHAGLPYTSTLTTFPIESQQSIGYEKRMPQASLGFYKSLMCEFGLEGGTMYPVTFDRSLLIYGGADELYTGYRRLAMDTQDDEELAITIRQTQPFPMGVSQIVPRIEITEGGR